MFIQWFLFRCYLSVRVIENTSRFKSLLVLSYYVSSSALFFGPSDLFSRNSSCILLSIRAEGVRILKGLRKAFGFCPNLHGWLRPIHFRRGTSSLGGLWRLLHLMLREWGMEIRNCRQRHRESSRTEFQWFDFQFHRQK